MTIKAILYIITVPIVIFSLGCVDYEKIIKVTKVNQARLLYFIVTIALSYLLVNFFYDFFLNSQII